MTMDVQTSLDQDVKSPGHRHGSGMTGPWGTAVSSFWEISSLISEVAVLAYEGQRVRVACHLHTSVCCRVCS